MLNWAAMNMVIPTLQGFSTTRLLAKKYGSEKRGVVSMSSGGLQVMNGTEVIK